MLRSIETKNREEEIGEVDHYYGKSHIAGIHILHGRVKVGDKLHFKGHTTDFEEEVRSMEVNHHSVREVGIGAHIGVPVQERVRMHDKVYIVHA